MLGSSLGVTQTIPLPYAILASLLASCLVNPITLGKDAGMEAAGLLQPIDDGYQLVVPREGSPGSQVERKA